MPPINDPAKDLLLNIRLNAGTCAAVGGVKKYLNERGHLILDALDEVAYYYESTPAAISLAWLMAQPAVVAPIASATSTQQLNELVNAAHLQLDQDTINLLNKASEY
jgi:aryl-alcohol dehydrogenase-like predicted oxidoreductase